MVCATTDDKSVQTDVSRVIICGGGVIGTAVSYYLAKRGIRSTVVDRCGLAAAASGRAGVLDPDWYLAHEWHPATGAAQSSMHFALPWVLLGGGGVTPKLAQQRCWSIPVVRELPPQRVHKLIQL